MEFKDLIWCSLFKYARALEGLGRRCFDSRFHTNRENFSERLDSLFRRLISHNC